MQLLKSYFPLRNKHIVTWLLQVRPDNSILSLRRLPRTTPNHGDYPSDIFTYTRNLDLIFGLRISSCPKATKIRACEFRYKLWALKKLFVIKKALKCLMKWFNCWDLCRFFFLVVFQETSTKTSDLKIKLCGGVIITALLVGGMVTAAFLLSPSGFKTDGNPVSPNVKVNLRLCTFQSRF